MRLAIGFRMAPMVLRSSMSRAAYVLTCIVLYSAIMFALAWSLWQVVPSWADGLMANFGVFPVFIAGIALIVACYLVAYFARRKDSGSTREP